MSDVLPGDRLETARLRRGMTTAAAARALGVTPRTYRRYEQDGAPVRQADNLATAFDFPRRFFVRDGDIRLDASEAIFRAGRRAPDAAKQAAVAVGRCGVDVDRYIRRRFVLPEVDLPDVSGHTPRTAARLLRDRWSLGDAPLPNLVQLCESRGVRVHGLPPSAYAVDAYSCWYDGDPYIFLARRRTPEGARFDIAHELGHLVMHRGPSSSEDREVEADEFASEFLLPRTALAATVPRHPGLRDILRVRSAYRASAMATAVSLHRAGFLSDYAYRAVCRTLAGKGFRSSEPGGMGAYERSRVFSTVFSPDIPGALSVASVADDLGIPRDDVHALILGTRLQAVSGTPGPSPGSGPPRRELVPGTPADRPALRVIR